MSAAVDAAITQEADKVYYGVTDPATEAFIREKSKGDCFDLRVYYDKDKNRYESYVQMCEVMLKDVRAGFNVLGIFYGHPGVFVSPSHRAIAIAREEGFRAKMLPGVSAEDYMVADLGFDPAFPGCMSHEATGILIHNRKLDPSIHNIIWQVGGIGVGTMVFDNSQFHHLVDRLEVDLGPDHRVIHYIGAVLPQSTTIMDEFTVADLRKEDVVKQFTPTSTLYIPPRNIAQPDQTVVQSLGLTSTHLRPIDIYPRSKWVAAQLPTVPAYGPLERATVERIASHVTPTDHTVLHASSTIKKFLTDLALSPSLLARYKADPVAVLDATPGLSAKEKFALSFGKPGPVYSVMRATPSAVASGQEVTLDEIAGSVEVPCSPFFLVDICASA
ncbi:tetrapyrrole methylase [Pisolithus marmoratus]|nr:tetrapyrrole methylase [Pisolithus marmoratus]